MGRRNFFFLLIVEEKKTKILMLDTTFTLLFLAQSQGLQTQTRVRKRDCLISW